MKRIWLMMYLSVLAIGCGGSGADEDLDVTGDVKSQGFELATDTVFHGVSHVASYGCRPDAFFVAVKAEADTGVYKFEFANPELGWRKIYDQEGLICPTSEGVAVALPPGDT